MSVTRLTPAIERSTYVVDLAFTDEAGVAIAPVSLTWTLTKDGGTVVNSRQAVVVTPATTVSLVLTGADLALGPGADTGDRALSVDGTYNSTLGSGLAIRDEYVFMIRNLGNVT